jgi:predicted Zn-dependent protease
MDTFPDHVGLWRLLVQCGRKDEALEMAQLLARRPTSAADVLTLAELYQEWSMKDRALRVFREFAGGFQESAELGVAYANALIEARRWEELRRVSVQMRVRTNGSQGALAAYSYYLEGRAELGSQRQFHATAAFERITEWDFDFPKLGLRASQDLTRLGYARLARDVLLKLEKPLALDAEYWRLLFQTAGKLNQTDLMLRAARRVYQLRPDDPAASNDYAAALLIERECPEEAIRLTLSAMSRDSTSIPARVNHAAALLLNERADEALALLKTIEPAQLAISQRTLYYFNLFQACHHLQRYGEAAQVRESIGLRDLYPWQAKWLGEIQRGVERAGLRQALLPLPARQDRGED